MNNEYELKYLILNNGPSSDMIIKSFSDNGFRIVSQEKKINCDYYFDTDDFYLYKNGGSFRIRKILKGNLTKYKGTYKIPIYDNYAFTSRQEIERNLNNADFDSFISSMKDCNYYLSNVNRSPILCSFNYRCDVTLIRDNNMICLSFDNCTYSNYVSYGIFNEKMIEIEMIKGDYSLLNVINDFLSDNSGLLLINDSKYVRGINSTSNNFKIKIKSNF